MAWISCEQRMQWTKRQYVGVHARCRLAEGHDAGHIAYAAIPIRTQPIDLRGQAPNPPAGRNVRNHCASRRRSGNRDAFIPDVDLMIAALSKRRQRYAVNVRF